MVCAAGVTGTPRVVYNCQNMVEERHDVTHFLILKNIFTESVLFIYILSHSLAAHVIISFCGRLSAK